MAAETETITRQKLAEDALASTGISSISAATKEGWKLITCLNVRPDRERLHSDGTVHSRELCLFQSKKREGAQPRWIPVSLPEDEAPMIGQQTGLRATMLSEASWKDQTIGANTFFLDAELLELVKQTLAGRDTVVALWQPRHGHCYVVALVVILKYGQPLAS